MEKKITPLLNFMSSLNLKVKVLEARERVVLLEVQGDTSTLSEFTLNAHLPFTVYAQITDIQCNRAVICVMDLEDHVPCVLKPFVPFFNAILWLYQQISKRWGGC